MNAINQHYAELLARLKALIQAERGDTPLLLEIEDLCRAGRITALSGFVVAIMKGRNEYKKLELRADYRFCVERFKLPETLTRPMNVISESFGKYPYDYASMKGATAMIQDSLGCCALIEAESTPYYSADSIRNYRLRKRVKKSDDEAKDVDDGNELIRLAVLKFAKRVSKLR